MNPICEDCDVERGQGECITCRMERLAKEARERRKEYRHQNTPEFGLQFGTGKTGMVDEPEPEARLPYAKDD